MCSRNTGDIPDVPTFLCVPDYGGGGRQMKAPH